MKVTTRIWLCFFVFFTGGFLYLVQWMLSDLRPRYLESTEEVLVDTSRILAAHVEQDVRNGRIETRNLSKVVEQARKSTFSAPIYGIIKTKVDLRIYVTNEQGTVLYDSDGLDLGKDYSRWNDVLKTLRGQYGARSTRVKPEDPATSVLHVASPIRSNGKILGVVSVVKSTQKIGAFLKKARRKIVITSITILLASLVLGLALLQWMARPIHRLTAYAVDIRDGKSVSLPNLGRNEFGTLGKAFQEMRETLEGKQYIERYIQNLTHELKSPLTAIRGASELLSEDISPLQRRKFLKNIQNETRRMQDIVDRVLRLSTVESLVKIDNLSKVRLAEFLHPVLTSIQTANRNKHLRWKTSLEPRAEIFGDPFLLRQAFSNLLQNAADFSPRKGLIQVVLAKKEGLITLKVIDEGPGIPDYAIPRVFERFYSLPRPDSGLKSTGLGLNFVQEIAKLHNGTIKLENIQPHGLFATLTFPATTDP